MGGSFAKFIVNLRDENTPDEDDPVDKSQVVLWYNKQISRINKQTTRVGYKSKGRGDGGGGGGGRRGGR